MATKKKLRSYGTFQSRPGDIVNWWRYTNNSVFSNRYTGYPLLARRQGLQSSLVYQTGNDGAFRPCSHTSIRYVTLPVPSTSEWWDNTLWETTIRNPGVRLTGFQSVGHQAYYSQFTSAITAASLQVESIPWASMAQTAINTMMPTLGQNNSLINFILELKDFRRLFLALTTRFISRMDVLRSILGYNWWDKTLQKLSKMYLSYQFGWKPFFNDLVEMFQSLRTFQDRIKHLKDIANTDLQKHFRTIVPGTSAQAKVWLSGDRTVDGNTGSTTFANRLFVTTSGTDGIRYNATLRFRFPFPPELNTVAGKLGGFLDSLGVRVDPSILWNAIPFSFLVDWVVNVNKWLGQLRIDNIRFQTEIRDFCHSGVDSRTIDYEMQWTRTGSYSTKQNIQVPFWGNRQLTDTAIVRQYIRKKGIPDFSVALQTSGLNWREFTLSGALLGAKDSIRRK